MMRTAADREDATQKSVVTPGPIKPARELLRDMRVQAGRPAEAARARAHYGRALTLWQNRDPDRNELRRARELIAAR